MPRTSPRPLSPIVRVILWVVVLAMIPVAALGIWHGVVTILADARMSAGGLTAQGRIVRVDEGRTGTGRFQSGGRTGEVHYTVAGEGGRQRWVAVSRATARHLRHSQTVVLRVDPANPDRHMLDRGYELFNAWLQAVGFGLLLLMALGLGVGMLRGRNGGRDRPA
jgi:hypothetical protein